MHNRRRQHDAATAVQWEVKQFLRDVLRILVLLWQWVPLNEMACLIQSLMHARASNLFAAVQGDAAAVMCGKCFPSWRYALGALVLPDQPLF